MPLLDNLLQGLPEDVKSNVQRVVINYKLDPDNPEVLLAVLCGHIESITRAIPARIAEETQKAASLAGAMAEKNIQLREREIQRASGAIRHRKFRNRSQSPYPRQQTPLALRRVCPDQSALAASCLYGGYDWGYGVRDADYRVEVEKLPKYAAWVTNNMETEQDRELIIWSLSDDGRQAKKLSDLNHGVDDFLSCFKGGQKKFEKGGKVTCFPFYGEGKVYGWRIE